MHDYAQAETAAYDAAMRDERSTHVAGALLVLDEDGQQLLEAIRELDRRLSDVLRTEVDASPMNVRQRLLNEQHLSAETIRDALIELAARVDVLNTALGELGKREDRPEPTRDCRMVEIERWRLDGLAKITTLARELLDVEYPIAGAEHGHPSASCAVAWRRLRRAIDELSMSENRWIG